MSKMVLALTLFCSYAVYDPPRSLDRLGGTIGVIGLKLQAALVVADRYVPRFWRFGR